MQAENDYDKDVYNGDLGFITRIDPEQGEVVVDFGGREVAYDYGELDELVPAYATTVHRAQGSSPLHLCSASARATRARAEAAALPWSRRPSRPPPCPTAPLDTGSISRRTRIHGGGGVSGTALRASQRYLTRRW